jgi:hypothetical protein
VRKELTFIITSHDTDLLLNYILQIPCQEKNLTRSTSTWGVQHAKPTNEHRDITDRVWTQFKNTGTNHSGLELDCSNDPPCQDRNIDCRSSNEQDREQEIESGSEMHARPHDGTQQDNLVIRRQSSSRRQHRKKDLREWRQRKCSGRLRRRATGQVAGRRVAHRTGRRTQKREYEAEDRRPGAGNTWSARR